MRPLIHQIVPPPRKPLADRPTHSVRQPFIDARRDRAESRRTLAAALVVCVGVGVAAFAFFQARETRTVYVPVPTENVAAAVAARSRPVAVEGTVGGYPGYAPTYVPAPATPPSRVVISAPAMPMTPFPVASVAMPTPVDYAARDRQITGLKQRMEEIDETIRRVRADPHYYGYVRGSTNTSRQQASDSYLDTLDRQRNDLRRQKWALEGR